MLYPAELRGLYHSVTTIDDQVDLILGAETKVEALAGTTPTRNPPDPCP